MITVLMPIEVPDSHYCWDGHTVCEHFDNTGGHETCDLNFTNQIRDKETFSILKDTDCLLLSKAGK